MDSTGSHSGEWNLCVTLQTVMSQFKNQVTLVAPVEQHKLWLNCFFIWKVDTHYRSKFKCHVSINQMGCHNEQLRHRNGLNRNNDFYLNMTNFRLIETYTALQTSELSLYWCYLRNCHCMLSKAPPTDLIGFMSTCTNADASHILIKVYLIASLINTIVFSCADMFTQGFFFFK